jgi:hypothetical protein
MKLLAVIGVLVVSNPTTMLPSVVTKVAWYVLPGSRQFGGGSLNVVIRGELPSAFGHGVGPLKVPPTAGAAVGGVAVEGVAVVEGLPAAVVDDPDVLTFFELWLLLV